MWCGNLSVPEKRPKPKITITIDGARYEDVGYEELTVDMKVDRGAKIEILGCDVALPMDQFSRYELSIVYPDFDFMDVFSPQRAWQVERGYRFECMWDRCPTVDRRRIETEKAAELARGGNPFGG